MLRLILFFVVLTLFMSASGFGQGSGSRYYSYSCIGLAGGSRNTPNFYTRSTVGQFNPTAAISRGQFDIRQGFQQPVFEFFQTIHKPQGIQKMSLYPNPNSGLFNLRIELEGDEGYRYQITDLGGRLISTGLGKSGELMPIDDLFQKPPAVYFLQIYDVVGQYLTTYRVLIQ